MEIATSLFIALLFSAMAVTHGNRFDDLGVSTVNEYDTYNADECQRIRRPWAKLSTQERSLYTSGLLELRKKSDGNVDEDELISIGTVHEDPLAFMHQTSAYLFWHGYLVWELESRIRNLGGKWKCFGMPYWDFTAEAGRESEPFILDSDIGGDGDANDYWTVNGYSWTPTVQQYWVPNNCVAQHDEYPFCSLKRALRAGFAMPSAKEVGATIMENARFEDFAEYSHLSGSAIHLIDDHPDYMDGFPQGYEPIWYMFHSAIQFHQALWTDCNQYDLLNVDELDDFPQAFTPFCNSGNPDKDTCDTEAFPSSSPWYGVKFDLDAHMHFGGTLKDKEWSYIHSKDISVRQLYMIPKWNVIYDLDDGQGFYADSGVQEWCKGKLNQHWFMTDLLDKDKNDDEVVVDVETQEALNKAGYVGVSSVSVTNEWYMYVMAAAALAGLMALYYYHGGCSSWSYGKIYPSSLRRAGSYGSV